MKPAEFARRLTARLGRRVSDQNIYRWTRDPDHDDFAVPNPDAVVAIYFETANQVPVEVWYAHLVSAQAKVAAARARQLRQRMRQKRAA